MPQSHLEWGPGWSLGDCGPASPFFPNFWAWRVEHYITRQKGKVLKLLNDLFYRIPSSAYSWFQASRCLQRPKGVLGEFHASPYEKQ